MKNCLLASVLALSLCGTVKAAEDDSRVPYSRSIPSYIRSHTARDSVTQFFGTRRVEPLHTDLFVHLYQPKQRLPDERSSDKQSILYWLDIFTREKGRLTRIQHIRKLSLTGNVHFGVDLLWLDAKRQKTPVLKLNIFNNGNFYGPTSSFTLFVFSRGLKDTASAQVFAGYGDHNESMGFEIGEPDEREFITVTQTYQQSGDQPDEITILRWDGKQFSPEQAQTK